MNNQPIPPLINFFKNIKAAISSDRNHHYHSTGAYVVEKTVCNRMHGSIYDLWLKNGALGTLSSGQRKLLHSQCVPKMSMEILEASTTGLVLEEMVEPFGFTLLKLRAVRKE
jgi:hypothetical protein